MPYIDHQRNISLERYIYIQASKEYADSWKLKVSIKIWIKRNSHVLFTWLPMLRSSNRSQLARWYKYITSTNTLWTNATEANLFYPKPQSNHLILHLAEDTEYAHTSPWQPTTPVYMKYGDTSFMNNIFTLRQTWFQLAPFVNKRTRFPSFHWAIFHNTKKRYPINRNKSSRNAIKKMKWLKKVPLAPKNSSLKQ